MHDTQSQSFDQALDKLYFYNNQILSCYWSLSALVQKVHLGLLMKCSTVITYITN